MANNSDIKVEIDAGKAALELRAALIDGATRIDSDKARLSVVVERLERVQRWTFVGWMIVALLFVIGALVRT